MERYGTFKVDHTKLGRGIYESRVDTYGNVQIVTIDIRTCIPYVDKIMTNMVMHSVEHVLATNLEAQDVLKKVYFGPMGCQTGFYFLFEKETGVVDSLPSTVGKVIKDAVDRWNRDTVPYNSKEECGNCNTLAASDYGIEDVRTQMDLIRDLADYLIKNNEFNKYSYL